MFKTEQGFIRSVLCNPTHRQPLHLTDTVLGWPEHVQTDSDDETRIGDGHSQRGGSLRNH
jgi:hypothetical protein